MKVVAFYRSVEQDGESLGWYEARLAGVQVWNRTLVGLARSIKRKCQPTALASVERRPIVIGFGVSDRALYDNERELLRLMLMGLPQPVAH